MNGANTRLGLALRFAAKGWKLFPQDRAKHPCIKDWPTLATTDVEQIRAWAKQFPKANFAVALGPSGLAVLDADIKGGKPGVEVLQRLEAAVDLQPGLRVRTGSGGQHRYLKLSPGLELRTLPELKDFPGIELKAGNAAATLPGSTYADGREYVLLEDLEPAEIPAPLVGILKNGSSRQASPLTPPANGVVPAGQRNAWLTRVAGSLRRAGLSASVIEVALQEENATRCRPPLDKLEVASIAASIGQKPAGQEPPADRPDHEKPRHGQGEKPQAGHRFKLVRVGALELTKPDWLVRGWMELDQLLLIFGDAGSCKTFEAVDFSCCIATGTAYHGLKVRQGPVIYVAGEGQRGVVRRFRAWAIRHQIDLPAAPLFLALQPARLLDPEAVQQVIEEIRAAAATVGDPLLVVFDTLNRNFGSGDENSPQDMGELIGAADQLRALWRCSVLFTHHSGHSDKTRSRGHSALHCAVDCEYRSDKDGDGIIRLEATKTKDGESPPPLAFKLCDVELGILDDEGQPVKSAVLEDAQYEPRAEKGKEGQGTQQAAMLKCLQELYSQCEENLEKEERDPSQARVTPEEWRKACLEAKIPRTTVYRNLEALERAKKVKTEHGYVYLAA